MLGLDLEGPEARTPADLGCCTARRPHFEEDLETGRSAIIYINRSWEIEKINMTAAHMFGSHTRLLEGKPFLAVVDANCAQDFVDEINNSLDSGQKQLRELKFRKIDGHAFAGDCEMVPVFDRNGRLLHLRTVITGMSLAMEPAGAAG